MNNIILLQRVWTPPNAQVSLPLQTKIYEIDTCTWGYKMPKNINVVK